MTALSVIFLVLGPLLIWRAVWARHQLSRTDVPDSQRRAFKFDVVRAGMIGPTVLAVGVANLFFS